VQVAPAGLAGRQHHQLGRRQVDAVHPAAAGDLAAAQDAVVRRVAAPGVRAGQHEPGEGQRIDGRRPGRFRTAQPAVAQLLLRLRPAGRGRRVEAVRRQVDHPLAGQRLPDERLRGRPAGREPGVPSQRAAERLRDGRRLGPEAAPFPLLPPADGSAREDGCGGSGSGPFRSPEARRSEPLPVLQDQIQAERVKRGRDDARSAAPGGNARSQLFRGLAAECEYQYPPGVQRQIAYDVPHLFHKGFRLAGSRPRQDKAHTAVCPGGQVLFAV